MIHLSQWSEGKARAYLVWGEGGSECGEGTDVANLGAP